MASFDNLIDELDDLVSELSDGGSEQEENSEMEESGEVEEEELGEEEGEELGEGETDEGDPRESDESDSDGGGDEEEVGVGDEEVEPAPEPKPDPNVEAIVELREQNRKLMEMLQNQQQPPQTPEQEVQPPAIPKTLDDLLGDLSFDEVMSDQTLFMGFMQNAMAIAAEQSVERVATTMPQYVINQVKQQQTLTNATDNFYEKNEQLVPHRKVVGMLANEVVAEHQDWNLDQVFEETAKRSYTLLNMKKEAIAESSAKPGPKPKPALNKKSRTGKRTAPKLSKIQAEINDLM